MKNQPAIAQPRFWSNSDLPHHVPADASSEYEVWLANEYPESFDEDRPEYDEKSDGLMEALCEHEGWTSDYDY